MRLLLAALALFLADLLLAFLVAPREATAGTARRLELAELAQQAELVVEARVLSSHPVDAGGLLRTECLLEVARTFKGAHEAYRAVSLPGGIRPDGSGLLIPGLPRLVPGEEALLFLSAEDRSGTRMPVGLGQGKLVLRTLADGRKRLLCELGSVELVGEGSAGHAARSVRDYAECVAAIEAALATPGTAGARR
jgi:hypothetical protein